MRKNILAPFQLVALERAEVPCGSPRTGRAQANLAKMVGTALAALALALVFALAGSAQEQSLAEAARKAREKKKDAPKATKVFTNDNIPAGGDLSVVGRAAPASKPVVSGGKKAGEEAAGEKEPEKGEQYWRSQFRELHTKLRQAEKERDILQRELNQTEVQYYSDPNKALREQLMRSDINKHRKEIEEKDAEIQRLKQQISDLEDDLRRSGGNPGWARE